MYPRLHEVGRKLEKVEKAVHWKERKRGNGEEKDPNT